jgi:hypothetical protein
MIKTALAGPANTINKDINTIIKASSFPKTFFFLIKGSIKSPNAAVKVP